MRVYKVTVSGRDVDGAYEDDFEIEAPDASTARRTVKGLLGRKEKIKAIEYVREAS